MTVECGWPFHNSPYGCAECDKWEDKYGKNLTEWLDQKAEVREAAKRERRTKRSGE